MTEEVEKLEEKLQKLKSQGNLVTWGKIAPPLFNVRIISVRLKKFV